MSNRFELELPPDVLARARAGERGAMACIYRSFEHAVYNLARRMCGDADAARDITQDTFVHAFERLGQFRGQAPFGRWLRAIAATEALQHLRAGRRFLELFAPHEGELDAPAPEPPEQEELERALATLPGLARSVLWLHYVEGYTHAEIGRMAGRSPSFSKSQLARAHRALRTLMRAQAPSVIESTGGSVKCRPPIGAST